MYEYCKREDDTLASDELECDSCREINCENNPNYAESERAKTLERFRSSEFASDIVNRMAPVFGLSEEEIAAHLASTFKDLERRVDDTAKKLIGEAITSHIGRYFDAKTQKYLDELFGTALAEKVLKIKKDDKSIVTTIQAQAMTRIKDFVNNLDNSNRRNGRSAGSDIDEAIKKLVDHKVDDALTELLEETIEKFNKEAMKKMMQGMCKAIQDDKRLLSMMSGSAA